MARHVEPTPTESRDENAALPLALPQAAKMLLVSEDTVLRWVHYESLPARMLDLSYHFDQAQLIEWAALHHRRILTLPDRSGVDTPRSQVSLADALQRGGIATQLGGNDRYEVFREAIRSLPTSALVDRDELLDRFISREWSGGAAIGSGIVVPHPRSPVVVSEVISQLRVCYLKYPLDFHAPDGKPVETLFLLICPTVGEYLRLLARLVSILQAPMLRQLLNSRPQLSVLVVSMRAEELDCLQEGKAKTGTSTVLHHPPNRI
ncbi:MAG: PTS sugar transporter subunit IIA [Planctomycetes bacterium]|nr:PTS sugar transporter subunit IIA [Planctomycetota bacterium]